MAGRQVVLLVTRGGRRLAPARISTGDLVAIREQKSRDTTLDTNQSPCDGVVISLDDKSVEVACDEPLQDTSEDSALFAVTKISSNVTHKRYTNSLETLQKVADDPTVSSYALTQVLFGFSVPRFDAKMQLNPQQEKLFSGLNDHQRDSVSNALCAKDLAVVHGPPGTGKTHTLVAYIMAEVLRGSRVLVVAPSNVAVDNIAERLAVLNPTPKFVRAGHSARIIQSVIPYSLDAQVQKTDEARLARDIRNELDDIEQKLRKPCQQAKRKGFKMARKELRKELRKRERSAVERLLKRMDIVLSTISGAGARVLDIAQRSLPFDVVVIDEAAQALEAACWIALLRARKAVLAGDPFQLAGTVKSREAEEKGLKNSILDRVFANPGLKSTVTMLKTQYRMNHVISTWSSQEFYEGELVSDSSVANHRVIDMKGCDTNAADDENLVHPFILIDTAGGDCEEDALSEETEGGQAGSDKHIEYHASKSNKGEAQIVEAVVAQFIANGVPTSGIAVISPYSGQVELLRNSMWSKYGRSLEIATIDSFQGREKEIVCMSLVRSNEGGEVGFLTDDRRLNVAITRARRCVVVVCDSETVSSHPLLSRMVDYAENFGHYRSAVIDFPEIVGTYSQLRRPKEAIEAEEHAGNIKKPKRRNGRKAERSFQNNHRAMGNGQVDTGTDRAAVREHLRTDIEMFSADESTVEKMFPSNLSSEERRIVHELCEERGLNHESFGIAEDRKIKVSKPRRPPLTKQGGDQMGEISTDQAKENAPNLFSGLADSVGEGSPVDSAENSEIGYPSRETPSKLVDDNQEPSSNEESTATSNSKYSNINSLLREVSRAREMRTTLAGNISTEQAAPGSSQQPGKAGKRKKKRKQNKGRGDSDEDFDAILAQYGAQADTPARPGLSGPVTQIVNGRLTTSVPVNKTNTQAKKKLAERLAQEAEKRKRKTKKKG